MLREHCLGCCSMCLSYCFFSLSTNLHQREFKLHSLKTAIRNRLIRYIAMRNLSSYSSSWVMTTIIYRLTSSEPWCIMKIGAHKYCRWINISIEVHSWKYNQCWYKPVAFLLRKKTMASCFLKEKKQGGHIAAQRRLLGWNGKALGSAGNICNVLLTFVQGSAVLVQVRHSQSVKVWLCQ